MPAGRRWHRKLFSRVQEGNLGNGPGSRRHCGLDGDERAGVGGTEALVLRASNGAFRTLHFVYTKSALTRSFAVSSHRKKQPLNSSTPNGLFSDEKPDIRKE